MILLDTHVLIWFLSGHKRLTKIHQKIIEEALEKKQVYLSAISIWELAVKEKSGKLELQKPLSELMNEIEVFINVLPVDPYIFYTSVNLSGDFHKDPADRIIIATALSGNYRFITYDEKILQYAQEEKIHCL